MKKGIVISLIIILLVVFVTIKMSTNTTTENDISNELMVNSTIENNNNTTEVSNSIDYVVNIDEIINNSDTDIQDAIDNFDYEKAFDDAINSLKTENIEEADAEKILAVYFELGEYIFSPRRIYDISKTETELKLKDNQGNDIELGGYKINNFKEIANKYVLKDYQGNMLNNKNGVGIVNYKNDYYVLSEGEVVDNSSNWRFENIKYTDDKITCEAVIDIVFEDEIIDKDLRSTFSVEKENGKWKISDYTFYDVLN